MTAFDLVLVLIVAETTQQALLGDDFSIVNAVILIITLFTLDILMSYLKEHSPRAEKLLDGVPTVLISLGKPDVRALKRARVDIEDVLESARSKHGVERLDQLAVRVGVRQAHGSPEVPRGAAPAAGLVAFVEYCPAPPPNPDPSDDLWTTRDRSQPL